MIFISDFGQMYAFFFLPKFIFKFKWKLSFPVDFVLFKLQSSKFSIILRKKLFSVFRKCSDKRLWEVGHIIMVENCKATHDQKHHRKMIEEIKGQKIEKLMLNHMLPFTFQKRKFFKSVEKFVIKKLFKVY